jgi:hypothetical protein
LVALAAGLAVDLAAGFDVDLAAGFVAGLAAGLVAGFDLALVMLLAWAVALGAGVELAVDTAMVPKVAKNNDAKMKKKTFLGPNTLHSPFSVAE